MHLGATGYTGALESVFARGQAVAGVAVLIGSIGGGFIAQATNLGVPYLVRAALLGITVVVALWRMHDLGFAPERRGGPVEEVRRMVRAGIDVGWKQRPIRMMMLAAPFTMGIAIYAFYAMQPYLLELYGDETAFGIAGLAAAAVGGSQVAGGLLVPYVRRLFRSSHRSGDLRRGDRSVRSRRYRVDFQLRPRPRALRRVGLGSAFRLPVRQAFINPLIPAQQRATVLSFDSLMGSAGGVVAQPALGRVADVCGYAASYVVSGAISALAIPFLMIARRERAPSDPIEVEQPEPEVPLV